MIDNPTAFLPAGLALALTLALVPFVRAQARRVGMVARPRADRWHKQPTALLGGVGIFAAVVLTYLLCLPWSYETLVVLGGSSFLFLVGLVDDLRNLKPYQKLIGQILGAMIVIFGGLELPWTPWHVANMGLTVLWIVGITNAVNLLDNMDGLAAGVSAIAAGFLAAHFWGHGLTDHAVLLAVFAAALVGFLVYNSNPASIFMGDCGSMFLGFFLSSAALLDAAGGRTRTLLPVLAVPVLVLFIPIFDVVLVSVLRKLAGRSIAQGGRDHSSHRLVALGLSERRAVWLLYVLAGGSGALSLAVVGRPLDQSLAAIAAFTIALSVLGVHLAGVKVYAEEEVAAASRQPLVAFLIDLSYKRRLFEVLLDAALIVLSYYGAYVLIFGTDWAPQHWDLFTQTVPILVFVQLGAFLAAGVYRGLWRYVSIDNLVRYGKAVALGVLASVFVLLLLFRFEGFSRAVFVADGLLLLVGLCGTRVAFRLLRNLFPQPRLTEGRRTLIYGAGDAGELLARELLNNHDHASVPVGFADDDPLKKGKVIHGLRVFGGNGSFLTICEQQRVETVIISSRKFTDDRVREILTECRGRGLMVKRMRLHIEALVAEDEN